MSQCGGTKGGRGERRKQFLLRGARLGTPRDHRGPHWADRRPRARLDRNAHPAFPQPVHLQSLLPEGTAAPVTPTFSDGR